jgi:hypothetical protein
MADRVRPEALKAALQTLRGYLDDLARSSFDEHATKLRLFVNYFQKDDVVRYLAERLHMRLRDVLKQLSAPKLELPVDPLDRLAFIYEVLFHLKSGDRLDVREFLSRAFEGGSIEGKWEDFRNRWLQALVEGMRELNERIESILDVEAVDPEMIFHIAMHSGVDDDFGDPEPDLRIPYAAPTEPELTPVRDGSPRPAGRPTLATLRSAIDAEGGMHKEALEAELEVLELELSKKKPDQERLTEIAGTFWTASPRLGEIVQAITTRSEPEPPREKKPAAKVAPAKRIAPKAAAPKPAAKKLLVAKKPASAPKKASKLAARSKPKLKVKAKKGKRG